MLKMKGSIYQNCVRSAMLNGSESWCLRENEMLIFRKTKKAMIRVMCCVKLVDERNSRQLMDLLGSVETLNSLPVVNSVRWSGHTVY